ncbi:MAG: DUF4621 domain-containing protein, partial [Bacteroidales bacterium]|nr:DUF4621 domain-containing protein [Bacteroidales bacterium]
RFFKEGSGDVIISADSVDVQIGDLAQKTQLEIILNVSFLDEQMNPTRAKTEPVVLGNIKDQKFSVKITDMTAMKDARHLKFSFVIKKPDNGTPITFKVSDFLSIAKLKIKKEGGISINLDDI